MGCYPRGGIREMLEGAARISPLYFGPVDLLR